MKCRIMRHFIWVYNVCQSTRLGVSGTQRVKVINEASSKELIIKNVIFILSITYEASSPNILTLSPNLDTIIPHF